MTIADLLMNNQTDLCGLVLWNQDHGVRMVMRLVQIDPVEAETLDLAGRNGVLRGSELMTSRVLGTVEQTVTILGRYSYVVGLIQGVVRRHGNPVGDRIEVEKHAYELLCESEELLTGSTPEFFMLRSRGLYVCVNARGQYVLRRRPLNAAIMTETRETREIERGYAEKGYPLLRKPVMIGGSYGIQNN